MITAPASCGDLNWEAVYRKHSAGVYQYLLHLSRQSQDAEDLLQETFIKAIRSASTLQQPERIRTWLFTIARNLFFDTCRQRAAQKLEPLSRLDFVEGYANAQSPSPEGEVLQADFTHALQQALAGMSEIYQTAFSLGIQQRLPYSEIAEVTGWSLAAVKINIFRARKMMAATLSEHR